MTRHFDSDDHAVQTGYLIGYLMERGVDLRPVMEGQDYTPVLRIKIPVDGTGYETIKVDVRVLP